MALHEDVVQGVRSWIKSVLELTDSQVLPFDAMYEKDFKEELPFLTVQLLAMRRLGVESRFQLEGDQLYGSNRSEYVLSINLQGFGLGSHDWLLELANAQHSIPAQEALDAAFLSVVRFGNIIDISVFLDTDMEIRHSVDLEMGLSVTGSKFEAVPLENVDISGIEFQKKPIDDEDDDSISINLVIEV